MILGTGIDIIEIARVERAAVRDSFVRRILAPREYDLWQARGHSIRSLAGAFAAKEAVSKAFGTGIGALGWQDMEVLHDEKGKPYIELSQTGQALMRERGAAYLHLSISHGQAYAIAQAILEGV